MTDNPYAAPEADVRVVAADAPALWNPNAAGNWSLLFTPVFGSFLVWRNWLAIGERQRAGLVWFIVSLVMLLPTMAVPGLGLLWLIIWYFGSARGQARQVRERWGNDYPRRPWLVPILIGFGAGAAVWTAVLSLMASWM